MDGMICRLYRLSTGGRGEARTTDTIRLDAPSAVMAQITLGTFDTASAEFGRSVYAYGVFTACTTTGMDPPLPAQEVLAWGTVSGPPRPVLVRNGLISLSYSLEIANCSADFVVNVFLWPGVTRL